MDQGPADIFLGGRDEYLAVGLDGSGWCAYVAPDLGRDEAVWVRFAEQPGGRLVVAELHVAGPRVAARAIRRLPLGAMEEAANSPAVAPGLRERIQAGVDHDPDLPREALRRLAKRRQPLEKMRRRTLRLRIPSGHRKPDSFYRQVAEIYARQGARSHRPAADIAEANGVPASTVHRWVREARRRGLIASPHVATVAAVWEAALDEEQSGPGGGQSVVTDDETADQEG